MESTYSSNTSIVALVVCRHTGSPKNYLFQAPADVLLKDGEKVFVDTVHGIRHAEVVSTYTCEEGGVTFNFAVDCAGARLPLKRVVGRMKLEKIHYPDAEEVNEKDIPFADIVYPEGAI